MLVIICQMLLLNKYSLNLLNAQIYLSHLSALVFLSSLTFLFSRWLNLRKTNYTAILYTLSFLLACVNLIVSLAYIDSYLSSSRFSQLPDVTSYPLASYVTQLQGLPFTESLSIVFDSLSLSSFLLMWIATAISLNHYRHKMGKIKYLLLIGIPLVYYIFPLQGYFGDIHVIPLTGITEIKWTKNIHLYDIIWMLHHKPFVSSCFGLTPEDIKTMSL